MELQIILGLSLLRNIALRDRDRARTGQWRLSRGCKKNPQTFSSGNGMEIPEGGGGVFPYNPLGLQLII